MIETDIADCTKKIKCMFIRYWKIEMIVFKSIEGGELAPVPCRMLIRAIRFRYFEATEGATTR